MSKTKPKTTPGPWIDATEADASRSTSGLEVQVYGPDQYWCPLHADEFPSSIGSARIRWRYLAAPSEPFEWQGWTYGLCEAAVPDDWSTNDGYEVEYLDPWQGQNWWVCVTFSGNYWHRIRKVQASAQTKDTPADPSATLLDRILNGRSTEDHLRLLIGGLGVTTDRGAVLNLRSGDNIELSTDEAEHVLTILLKPERHVVNDQ